MSAETHPHAMDILPVSPHHCPSWDGTRQPVPERPAHPALTEEQQSVNHKALSMLSQAGGPMTLSDDASLLARYARSRDPAAFTLLVQRHAGLVYGTCLRQCGDHTLAEDASQECFPALATHAAEIRQSLVGWLHAVALHSASRLGRARRDQALHRHRFRRLRWSPIRQRRSSLRSC